MAHLRSPVPPMPEVHVGELAADVLDAPLRLDGGVDHPVAELVAEDAGETADDHGAKWGPRGDAQLRLAQLVQ